MAAPKVESVNVDVNEEDVWMVRPCELYSEEYKDCNSFRGRINQHYVYGERMDCSKWLEDYKNCLKFRKTKSPELLKSIISNENERRAERLRGANGNNVWEYRTSPPGDWNVKIRDWDEHQKDSLMTKMLKYKKSQTVSPSESQKRCVIS